MQDTNLVSTVEFCRSHNIDFAFLESLNNNGLVQLVNIEQHYYVDSDHLYELEKIIRLHYELEVNVEGVEVILHLLKKMEVLQHELQVLRQKSGEAY